MLTSPKGSSTRHRSTARANERYHLLSRACLRAGALAESPERACTRRRIPVLEERARTHEHGFELDKASSSVLRRVGRPAGRTQRTYGDVTTCSTHPTRLKLASREHTGSRLRAPPCDDGDPLQRGQTSRRPDREESNSSGEGARSLCPLPLNDVFDEAHRLIPLYWLLSVAYGVLLLARASFRVVLRRRGLVKDIYGLMMFPTMRTMSMLQK
jgi:hypothetical protein